MSSKNISVLQNNVFLKFKNKFHAKFIHQLCIVCTFTFIMLLLCTKVSFAENDNTVTKTSALNNAWTQGVFTDLISKDQINMLYSIAGGKTYSGGGAYANNYDDDSLDASGYGGLIYLVLEDCNASASTY